MSELSLEQLSALLVKIHSGLGPAASQLWKEDVNTEALLAKLTKQDMHMVGISLGHSVLIYDHFHPIDAGRSELSVTLGYTTWFCQCPRCKLCRIASESNAGVS